MDYYFIIHKTTHMKLKLTGLCCLLATVMLVSCKKSATTEQFTNYPQTLEKKIKTWLGAGSGFRNYQVITAEGKEMILWQNIEWKKMKYFSANQTVILPVTIESGTEKLPLFKYLVIVMDNAGKIVKGNFYDLLTQDMASIPVDEQMIVPELFHHKQVPAYFTGSLIMYDVQNKLLSSVHYESGKMTVKTATVSARQNKTQPTVQNTAPLDPGCSYVIIDWFWQVWINGVLVYEEYFGTSAIVVCDGGGGGGGTSGDENGVCNMTQAEGRQLLNGMTYERYMISACTPPVNPPQEFTNWPKVSPRSCSTGVVKLHFFGNFYVTYMALFTGIIKKTGQNVPWKWQEFQYRNTVITEGGIPPCIDVQKTITANTAISGDGLYGIAVVNYSFTTRVLCLFNWEPSSPYTSSFTQSFEAN